MGDENNTQTQQQVQQPAPVPVVAQQQTQQQPPPPQNRGDKVVQLTRQALAKQQRENEEKGRRSALSEIEKKAQALGYASVDEMLAAAESFKRNGQQRQPQNQNRNGGNGNGKKNGNGRGNGQQQQDQAARSDRKNRELQARLDRERKERIAAQRKAEESQREAWSAEAHGQLKIIALQTGVKDPDYAVELLTRECSAQQAKLDEAGYQKWITELNEQQFFEGLKKDKPFLFQETVVPANTGTQTDPGANAPPGAGTVTQAQARAGQKSAKQMSREEYAADLRKRGLTPPSY